MAYTRLDKLLTLGTAAERAAFTPDPPAGVLCVWLETDTGDLFAWDLADWVQVNGGGTPTAHAASHAAGGADEITPASIGAAPAGAPSAFTSRTLTDADDADTLVCATAQTATVNTGLRSGFGCSFKGAVSFSGTATVTDVRTTGAANPWCALVQAGTDTYDAVGGNA